MGRGGISLTSAGANLPDVKLPRKFHYEVTPSGKIQLDNVFLKAVSHLDLPSRINAQVGQSTESGSKRFNEDQT